MKLGTQHQPADLEAWYHYWAQRGWPVIPLFGLDLSTRDEQGYACDCREGLACESRGKHPVGRLAKGGHNGASMDLAVLTEWARAYPNANVGGRCDGRLVLDVDVEKGGAAWPEWETKRHYSGRGDGGGHAIYKLTRAQQVAGIKLGVKRLRDWDIRVATRGYVVLPPSLHAATGLPYTEDGRVAITAPAELVEALLDAQGGAGAAKGSEGSRKTGSGAGGGGEGSVSSLLSSLLRNPPKEGGRNDWLARICGYYAKDYRRGDRHDVYIEQVAIANRLLAKPLGDAEVKKTQESMWRLERANHTDEERSLEEQFDTVHGLIPGGAGLLCQVWESQGEGEAKIKAEDDWANFDLRVTGKMRDEEGDLSYVVTVRCEEAEFERVVRSDLFGDAKKLGVWLAGVGGVVLDPEQPVVRKPGWAARLQLYVQNQEAKTFRLTKTLGWDERAQQFLTHDGALTGEGAVGWNEARPDPQLKANQDATYHYGEVGTAAEAKELLRQVLTFHDEQTVAVAGAWWAATLLKHQVVRYTSLFPVLAVEAGSGSGKTTGFFPQLLRLGGSCSGASDLTGAVLRNSLSTNPSGVVWLDDKDNPAEVHEIMRQLTAGGTKSKMAEDRITTLHFHLVNSLLFSGEALGFKGEKALLDRAVLLRPSSPKDRKSVVPGREHLDQWLDVQELDREAARMGPAGLAEVAGHLVVSALRESRGFERELIRLRGKAKGRAGDREVVLLSGAWLLEQLIGDTGYVEQVQVWLDENVIETFDGDNTLTRTYLPWYLRERGMPTDSRPAPTDYDQSPRAAFIRDERSVWFSPDLLASVLRRDWHGKSARDLTLESVESIREQAKKSGSVGVEYRRQYKTIRTPKNSESGAKVTYWRLPAQISEYVLERAEGAS